MRLGFSEDATGERRLAMLERRRAGCLWEIYRRKEIGDKTGYHTSPNETAKTVKKEIKMKIMKKEEFTQADPFGLGDPNDAYAQYFLGNSYLHPLTDPQKTAVFFSQCDV